MEFFGGATFAFGLNRPGARWGVTMGSFINLRVNGNNTNIVTDPLYMHEYGHTIQSQTWGLLYPFLVMVPSPISAANATPVAGAPGLTTHDQRWYEMAANRYAARYFGRYFEINWVPFEPPLGSFPRRR